MEGEGEDNSSGRRTRMQMVQREQTAELDERQIGPCCLGQTLVNSRHPGNPIHCVFRIEYCPF